MSSIRVSPLVATLKTNDEVERLNRTLRDESSYACLYCSEATRARVRNAWLHHCFHHPHHSAIKGAHASRLCNLTWQNS